LPQRSISFVTGTFGTWPHLHSNERWLFNMVWSWVCYNQ